MVRRLLGMREVLGFEFPQDQKLMLVPSLLSLPSL